MREAHQEYQEQKLWEHREQKLWEILIYQRH